MKKLFAIILCATAVFLTACGMNSGGEPKTTANDISESGSAPYTTQLSDGSTTSVYDRPIRMRGDYDSVPTVTQPQLLPNEEKTTVKIHTSKKDPYSYVVKEYYEHLIKEKDFYTIECSRYSLYDIDGDGSDELIFGIIDVLGGTDVYDVGRVTIEEAPFVYGLQIAEVYSIRDGKALRQDGINMHGGASYLTQILTNGIMKVCDCTPALPNISYYRFVDGIGEYMATFRTCTDGTFTYTDRDVTDQVISKNEFDRQIAEIEGDAKPVELEWKHLQDYGK